MKRILSSNHSNASQIFANNLAYVDSDAMWRLEIIAKQSKASKAKLYFNDQSQVNQCTLENKYIYNLRNGHCGRHQKSNLCLFRMSPFYGRHNK